MNLRVGISGFKVFRVTSTWSYECLECLKYLKCLKCLKIIPCKSVKSVSSVFYSWHTDHTDDTEFHRLEIVFSFFTARCAKKPPNSAEQLASIYYLLLTVSFNFQLFLMVSLEIVFWKLFFSGNMVY